MIIKLNDHETWAQIANGNTSGNFNENLEMR
jgi:hypothetical protein